MNYEVELSSVGNPDFGQDPHDPQSPYEKFPVDSLEEASEVCQSYISDYQLGGGNWTGGKVTDNLGCSVARISYNGRIWPTN